MNQKAARVIEHEPTVLVNKAGKQLSAADVAPRKEIATQSGVSDLIAMAINADLDIEKLERLMEMKEREEAKTAFSAFVVAISNFQAHCPKIPKTGTVTDKSGKRIYNYPKLDKILEIIQPHLEANGLCVRTNSEFVDTTVRATCKVSHVGGHTDETTFVIPIEASMAGGANAGQRTASANSFARRYAMMNALNLVGSDEDDDGASDIETITREQAATMRDNLASIDDQAEADFCKWIKYETLEDIPAKLLVKATNAITEQKKARK